MTLDVTWANTDLTNRRQELDLYHNYYNSIHELYQGRIKKFPHLNDLIHGSRANICRSIVDILASRLDIETIQSDNEEANEYINKYFRKYRVKSLIKSVVKSVSIYGDAYLSLWKDTNDEDFRLYEKIPFNTTVHYNGKNEIDCGLSYQTYRDLNNIPKTVVYVYYPDMIYKSEYDGEGLQPTLNISEEFENPYGIVPIFHFYNGVRPTEFMRSDLTDIIPLQRNLNAIVNDRLIASKMSACKMKFATGITMEYDNDGKPINPFESGLASMFMSENENARFGEFSETPLSNYNETIESIHREISAISHVPLHLLNLSGSIPSGQALLVSEEPMMSKIKDKQVIIGDVLEDLFSFILTQNNYSFDYLDTIWNDVQISNKLEQTQIAGNLIGLGVAPDTVLSELGYTLDEKQEQSFYGSQI